MMANRGVAYRYCGKHPEMNKLVVTMWWIRRTNCELMILGEKLIGEFIQLLGKISLKLVVLFMKFLCGSSSKCSRTKRCVPGRETGHLASSSSFLFHLTSLSETAFVGIRY